MLGLGGGESSTPKKKGQLCTCPGLRGVTHPYCSWGLLSVWMSLRCGKPLISKGKSISLQQPLGWARPRGGLSQRMLVGTVAAHPWDGLSTAVCRQRAAVATTAVVSGRGEVSGRLLWPSAHGEGAPASSREGARRLQCLALPPPSPKWAPG